MAETTGTVRPSALDRLFKLTEHATSVRTEVIAGVTTFLTMAYIIFVNPQILATTGMGSNKGSGVVSIGN